MTNLLTWEEVKTKLDDSEPKSVLLGNGFSISYKSDDFNQRSILKEMPSLKDTIDVQDIEECVRQTQALVSEGNSHTISKNIIDGWIKEKLHKEFIEKLFQKMPATIKDKEGYDERTLKPYKEFLSNFDSFFTLNYDPLLYWMSLHFINKGDKDVNDVFEQEKKLAAEKEGTDKFIKAETRQQEKFGKCIASIREDLFTKTIKKEDYKMKIFYDDKCLYDEPLTKAEADKAVSIKKITSTIYNNMEVEKEGNANLKAECERIDEAVMTDYDCKRKEIIANNDGIQINFTDGFDKNNGLLQWSSENPQTAFFMHGAFHILEKDNNVIKIKADPANTMLKNIKEEWEKGFNSITILESEHKNKMEEIENSEYLKFCFEKFKNAQGILVTFGVSFYDSDKHIINAINGNTALTQIYIGCYESPSEELLNQFKENDKVEFFTTKHIFNNNTKLSAPQ